MGRSRRDDDKRDKPDGVPVWQTPKEIRRDSGRVEPRKPASRNPAKSLGTLANGRYITRLVDPHSPIRAERGPISYGITPERQAIDMRQANKIRQDQLNAPTEGGEKRRTWRDPVLVEGPGIRKPEPRKTVCKPRPATTKRGSGGGKKKFVPWCK